MNPSRIQPMLSSATFACVALSAPACLGGGFGDANEEVVEPSPCGESQGDIATLTVPLANGVDETYLGRPANNDLEFLTGPDGRSIFRTHEVRENEPKVFQHQYVRMDNSRKLGAHLRVWGNGGGGSSQSSTRYATYRAMQIDKTKYVDDTKEIRALSPDALFFLHKIHYGRMYEAQFSGDMNAFSAEVAVGFWVFSGSMESYAERNRLRMTASGKGCSPKGDGAIFAKTEDQIERNYDCSGEPAAILGEYRSIPKSCLPDSAIIDWEPATKIEISFPEVKTGDPGCQDDDGITTWNLRVTCKLNGQEIHFDDPFLFEGETISPGRMETNFLEYLYATEGDHILCSTEGQESDCSPPDSLPAIVYEYDVKARGQNEDFEESKETDFENGDYGTTFRMRFMEDDDIEENPFDSPTSTEGN